MDKELLLKEAYDICIKKTLSNMNKIGSNLNEYPGSKDGNYFDIVPSKVKDFFHIQNWTSSFFTGMSAIAFETSKDEFFLKWLNSFYDIHHRKIFDFSSETMHDLGFIYSLYSVALYKLTGDINHKKVALKAADELAKRYIIDGEYIKAWGRMDQRFEDVITEISPGVFNIETIAGLAIVDCMMNLGLLFWASKETNNSFYSDVAKKHADTTIKHFIREDGSIYHAFKFDPITGEPIKGCNYCGYADESFWARGTAWAIYGFAVAYSYTNEERYLETSMNLALKFIENLDESIIPTWDFKLPENEMPNKDSSSAAIAICGFMEILKYKENEILTKYVDKILVKLTEDYLNKDLNVNGLIKECNGNNTYTCYGDYFYMEALARQLFHIQRYW